MGHGCIQMTLPLIVIGFGVGMFFAMPVGPLGIFCIHRMLSYGRAIGIASGVGAAVVDGCFAFIAGMGTAYLHTFINAHENRFQFVAGTILCLVGLHIFRSKGAAMHRPVTPTGLLKAFLSTALLAMSSPITILIYFGILASLSIDTHGGQPAYLLQLATGVVLGASSWWFILAAGEKYAEKFLNQRVVQWVGRISGGAITAFGAVEVVRAAF